MSKIKTVKLKDEYMNTTFENLMETLDMVVPDEKERRDLCLDLTLYTNKQKHMFGEPEVIKKEFRSSKLSMISACSLYWSSGTSSSIEGHFLCFYLIIWGLILL